MDPSFHLPSPPMEHHSSSTHQEELTLDDFLNDAKTKNKIQQLAAMVGVHTTEPAIVLTEVVRALKLFNHYYNITTSK
ncbi:hypothetical protein ACSQ67_005149 [Phaseolus vulgaris]